MKHTLFLFLFLVGTMSLLSQEKEILLFPNGAPGENVKLKQVDDASGNKVAGCPVLRVGNVSEPTLTFYPAPVENNSGVTIIGVFNFLLDSLLLSLKVFYLLCLRKQ
jgi:hypothetical protein